MKKIGILTSGGDCQGLNAAIRGVAKGLYEEIDDVEIYGIQNGYAGLIHGDYKKMNQSDFSDLYNIIYGHNMNNGSMFGSLKKYKDEGFWKKNQYFTVYTESTAYRYQIFSYEDAVVGGNVYKVGYQPGKNTRRLLTRW